MIAAIAAHDGDKVARVSDSRNRVQQGRADPTEHSAVGGDAERQCERGDGSESGRLHQNPYGIATIPKEALEQASACFAQHNRLSTKIPFDATKASGEGLFTFEFIESGAERGVYRLAAGEKFLVAIFEVLRKLIGDLGYACGREV
jgi:hypothetical protein